MKKVYKYMLSIVDRQQVRCPHGAQPLCVKLQRERPCLWCLVDKTEKLSYIDILCVGTGIDIELEPGKKLGRYLGTVLTSGGDYVFHYFVVEDE